MGFFNLHKPLQYKYRFIYYDPKKEAQKEREKETNESKVQVDSETKPYKPSIQRGTFREMASQRHDRRAADKQSNIRLIVIIAVLLLVMWLLIR